MHIFSVFNIYTHICVYSCTFVLCILFCKLFYAVSRNEICCFNLILLFTWCSINIFNIISSILLANALWGHLNFHCCYLGNSIIWLQTTGIKLCYKHSYEVAKIKSAQPTLLSPLSCRPSYYFNNNRRHFQCKLQSFLL